MNRFAFAEPRSFKEASALLSDRRFSLPMLKAGGIDLIDHLKEGLARPDALVNIRRLRSTPSAPPVTEESGIISIEATATLTELAESSILLRSAPVVAQAVESAASPQVRNVATAAGNLLQRPRCWYYRHEQFDCLKKGGSTCFAFNGENRYHAIFGAGPCYIVHPSNLAPALNICSGFVHVTGSERDRIPLSGLFHMPERGIRDEHNLEPGEIITHITLSPAPNSGFYAVKEKQSFDWPLVAAFVALDLDGETITAARVCAGAVAPIPWRLPRVEGALRGVRLGDRDALREACGYAIDGARPLADNAFKVPLLPVAILRATLIAGGRRQEVES